MNIAVAFYGKSDTITSYWDKEGNKKFDNIQLLLDLSSKSLKENIIQCNINHNFNFFFHTWESKYEKNILSLYDFKNYMFEKPIKSENEKEYLKKRPKEYHCDFNTYNVERSRLHSMKRVLRIIKNYKVKYDLIILLRFDVHFNTKLKLSDYKFDKLKIYNPIQKRIYELDLLREILKNKYINNKNLENILKYNKRSNLLKEYKLYGTYFKKNISLNKYDKIINNFKDFDSDKVIKKNLHKGDLYCCSDLLYIFNSNLIWKFIEATENCSRYIRANGSIPKYLDDKYNIKFNKINNFYEPINIGLTREIYKIIINQ